MLEIRNIKIDGRKGVFGLSCDQPSISWELYSDKNDTLQVSYRIVVLQDGKTAWDSNTVTSCQSQYIKYDGKQLIPHKDYL